MPDEDPVAPEPDDDLTKLPEGVVVIAAEDSDDEDNTQGGVELTDDVLEELARITEAAND